MTTPDVSAGVERQRPTGRLVLLPVALAPLTALALAQAPVAGFVYTPVGLNICAVTESSEFEDEPPIDYFSSECPGFGGY